MIEQEYMSGMKYVQRNEERQDGRSALAARYATAYGVSKQTRGKFGIYRDSNDSRHNNHDP